MKRRLLISALASVCALAPWTAVAQDAAPRPPVEQTSDDPAAAFKRKVERAKEAFEAADYRRAIELLREAYRLRENPRLLLNIARSFEKMDDCARALVYYRSYLRHPRAEERFSDFARDQMAQQSDCEAFSDKLAGRLDVTSDPPGALIKFNGRPVGETPIELVGAMSGDHEVTVALDGFEPQAILVRLDPAEDELIRVKLEKKIAPPDPPPAPIDPKSEPSYSPLAIGLSASGAAILGVGLIFDLVAIPATDSERAPFAAGTPEFDRLTSRRNRQATLAVTSYVVGGALTASGMAWLITNYAQKQAARDKDLLISVQPTPGMRGASVRVRF